MVPKLVHDDEDAKDCRDHFALLSLLRRMFDGTEQQVLAQGSRQIPMLPCCSSFSLGWGWHMQEAFQALQVLLDSE